MCGCGDENYVTHQQDLVVTSRLQTGEALKQMLMFSNNFCLKQ